MSQPNLHDKQGANWINLGPVPKLKTDRRALVKVDGHQIALFEIDGQLFAINNRCPHEGYPLIEGTVKNDCRLACNWHGWTFDLKDGQALVGRDPVRRWSAEQRQGDIWIDMTPPEPVLRLQAADKELAEAFDDHDYDRMARALARRLAAGGSSISALERLVTEKCVSFERGFGHAHAGLADWLLLSDQFISGADYADKNAHVALVPPLEALAHLSYDARMSRDRPLPDGTVPWDEAAFFAAVERQDEEEAIALIRGAFNDGLKLDVIFDLLSQAALSHYTGFGHGLIYVTKLRALAKRFSQKTVRLLTLMQVRYLCLASREDLIPDFRALQPVVASWGGAEAPDDGQELSAHTLSGLPVGKVLALVSASAGKMKPKLLHEFLAAAAALSMLRFDPALMDKTRIGVSDSVTWLDFTHALTFALAVYEECERQPELWPQGLAQMACFVGRNSRYLKDSSDGLDWSVSDGAAFIEESALALLGQDESSYIHGVHRLKTLLAVSELSRHGTLPENRSLLLAALNRYLNSPIRHRNPLRSAWQATALVKREG